MRVGPWKDGGIGERMAAGQSRYEWGPDHPANCPANGDQQQGPLPGSQELRDPQEGKALTDGPAGRMVEQGRECPQAIAGFQVGLQA